jgi:AcrR family transcriptional regulator
MCAMRMPLPVLQTRVCEAAAELMAEGRFDALSPSAVVERSGLSRGLVQRAFPNSVQLATGMYRIGHDRIAERCERPLTKGVSGVDAVIELVYDLVEQAAADPLVRAVHVLGLTEHAGDSGLESIYRLWQRRMTTLLVHGGDVGPDEMIADADYRHVCEAVAVLVDALTGLSASHSPVDVRSRLDRVHMLLTAVLPSLCVDARHASYLRQYLSRVRDYASVGAR